MEMRIFGRTGLPLSVLGFGCGAVGGLMVRGEPLIEFSAWPYTQEDLQRAAMRLHYLSGDRAGLGASYAGNYTLVAPGFDDSTTLPAGDSFGSLKVDVAGRVKFAGTLADGTKVSQTASLSKGGYWPLYVPLYSGNGSLMSWLAFASTTNSDLSGRLT